MRLIYLEPKAVQALTVFRVFTRYKGFIKPCGLLEHISFHYEIRGVDEANVAIGGVLVELLPSFLYPMGRGRQANHTASRASLH